MLIGLGNDIIEIQRVKRAIERGRFIERFFTKDEIEYLRNKKVESYAGYFCAKEAVVKALGTGFRGFKFKDIEIIKINDVPCVNLHGEALNIAEKKRIKKIYISISHCKEYATAFAAAEGEA